ncbi:MAG TPA: TetR family transcriptional regulator [Ktedonobacterales bacterium]|jgi:AcrR family transcriptional regulator|nr:TetR family transcriptional regulator [Ktedonobacterales bacterium]
MNVTNSLPHDDAHPPGLRERKKRLVQVTIEEAALQLFQQRGYERTSIQDIADAVMMSPRTFFRYFASKEEVLFGPMRAIQSDALRKLEHVASTASPHVALRTIFTYLASGYQQQRASFLIRYQVALGTPSIASIYLYALTETEPEICAALCSHLEAAANRNQIRFLVAVYMAALRVSIEEWLEHEASDDLVALLGEHLDKLSSLPLNHNQER